MSEQARKMTGCKMLHYATVTSTAGAITFGVPKKIPHIEEYNYTFLYAEASNYADNQQNIYKKKITGADLGLVLSELKGAVEAELMGKTHAKGGTVTNTNDQQIAVAILWEETYSDGTAVRNVFYNCKLSKDEVSGKTEGESLEFTADKLVGKAIPLSNGDIHYKLDNSEADYDSTKFNDWFTKVQTIATEEAQTAKVVARTAKAKKAKVAKVEEATEEKGE